ncbi:MAG: FkbM family methyltransferase [Pirellulaceae bacterium]
MTLKECTLPNGQRVFYRSKADVDILTREIFAEPFYLRHGLRIEDGNCIFDVGANIGFFLLQLGQQLQRASVYSFEPVPEVFEVLRRNAERHCLLDHQLFNCGLSHTPGKASFTYFPRTSVASTMYPDSSREFRLNSRRFVLAELAARSRIFRAVLRVTPEWLWYPLTEAIRRYYQRAREVTCELRRLSDVIDEHGVRQIDLLKVDTEGAEEDVLRGIEPHHWPLIGQLVVEVHHGRESVRRMESLLRAQGFATVHEQLLPTVEHLHIIYARRGGQVARG